VSNQSADNRVLTTLETIGLPVSRVFRKKTEGDADEYITFMRISLRNVEFEDDEETAHEYLYRADVFSRGNYTAIVKNTVQALKSADFYGISVAAEIYENDTGYYHAPIEFYYMED